MDIPDHDYLIGDIDPETYAPPVAGTDPTRSDHRALRPLLLHPLLGVAAGGGSSRKIQMQGNDPVTTPIRPRVRIDEGGRATPIAAKSSREADFYLPLHSHRYIPS